MKGIRDTNTMETEKQEKFQSRWFFWVFFLAVFLSVFATFYRVFIAKNYLVDIETACSPETEACFARDICDTEDQTCAEGDTPTGTSYYKTVERKAFAFPEACASGSLDSPLCADLSCRSGEVDCTETFCSDETVPEGETCVGPGVVPEESMTPDESALEDEESGDAMNEAPMEDSSGKSDSIQMNEMN
ncbi:MAG: hypothetical protein WBC29_01205 [Candidatus Moraniibacteriota bacterium]